MARLETLKKLETTLESFLDRLIASEPGQPDFCRELETLGDIKRDSLRGRHINSRLGNWFARNNNFWEGSKLQDSEIADISNMLREIKKGLDDSDPESKKLSDEIAHWHENRVIPGRKLVLKKKQSENQSGISEKFTELLNKEAEYFSKALDNKKHLLSLLDDVLKSAEAKEDPMFIHLAGSIIYYLKMRGYKVGPFVKRLKEIEEIKLGTSHVE